MRATFIRRHELNLISYIVRRQDRLRRDKRGPARIGTHANAYRWGSFYAIVRNNGA